VPYPDALEHVDDIVDPAALDAEPLGRVVQPHRLHVIPVVQRHEATRKGMGPTVNAPNAASIPHEPEAGKKEGSLGAEKAERLLLPAVRVVATGFRHGRGRAGAALRGRLRSHRLGWGLSGGPGARGGRRPGCGGGVHRARARRVWLPRLGEEEGIAGCR
jgi:hypothetical protein